MTHRHISAILMVCLVLLSAMVPASVFAEPFRLPFGPDDEGAPDTEEREMADWTIIVYLDGDNNLEGAAIEDLNEMETVGSNGKMHILVIIDRAKGYDTSNGDWEGAKVLYMEKDADSSKVTSIELEDLGEINMGDPEVLINFTTWVMDEYPARHYLLDFWNHGGAFMGVCWDDDVPGSTHHDNIDLENMSYALGAITAHLGRKIDIVAFDACLMGTVSVMYSLYGYTDVAIASGPVEPNEGWPYELILSDLASRTSMTPRELASRIVIDYIESYSDREDDPIDSPKVTQAAWDMERMPEVFTAVNEFGMALAMNSGLPPGGSAPGIAVARNAAHSYDIYAIAGVDLNVAYPLYDLYDLASRIIDEPTIMDEDLERSADRVKVAVKAANIETSAGLVAGMNDIMGLSAYFPTGDRMIPIPDPAIGPASAYSSRYDPIQWSKDQYWDDFLKTHWDDKVSASDTPPTLFVENAMFGVELMPDEEFILRGTASDLQGGVRVQVSINGSEWEDVPMGTNSRAWEVCLENLTDGQIVNIRAQDGSGQSTPSISRMISMALPDTGVSMDSHQSSFLFMGLTMMLGALMVVLLVMVRRQ